MLYKGKLCNLKFQGLILSLFFAAPREAHPLTLALLFLRPDRTQNLESFFWPPEVEILHSWKYFCLIISPPMPRTKTPADSARAAPGARVCRAGAQYELSNLSWTESAVNWKPFAGKPITLVPSICRSRVGQGLFAL